MNNFPHLKEAISSKKIVDTPLEEHNELGDFLNGTRNIKYMNEYYEILLSTT
jgi:hypothetical protein